MAKFKLQGPDGGTYVVTAPDAESAHEALYGSAQPQAPAAETADTGLGASVAAGGATGLVGAALDTPVMLGKLATEGVERLTGKKSGIDWNYWMPSRAFDTLAMPEHNPEYETARSISSMVAPVVVGGGLGRYATANPLALAKTAAGDLAKTGALAAGAKAGEAVGDAVIGGDFGKDLGSFLGGGAVPASKTAALAVGNRMLTDQTSARRLAAVDFLNRHLGPDEQLKPSIGLVGSKFAGQIEDAAAGTPFGGGPALDARYNQYAAFDRLAGDIAGNLRGQAPSGPISRATVGNAAANAGQQSAENLRTRISNAEQGLEDAIGPASGVDISGIRNVVNNFVKSNTVGSELKDAPRARMSILEQDRNIEIDPILGAALRAAQPTSVALGQAVRDAIEANTGVSYGALKDWNSLNGRSIDGMVPLATQIAKPMYGATVDAMRETARRVGGDALANQFDAVRGETARLHNGPIPVAESIGNKNEGAAYNAVFSPTNAQSPSIIRDLQEGAPAETRRMLADNMELQLRGSSAGHPAQNAETFNTKNAAKWLGSLPQETRHLYSGTDRGRALPGNQDLFDLMNALQLLNEGDIRRPTRTLPGGGGNTLGAPGQMYTAPVAGALAMLAAGPSGWKRLPAAALGAVGPSLLARAMGGKFTDPAVVRSIVQGPDYAGDFGRALPVVSNVVNQMNPPVPVEAQQ